MKKIFVAFSLIASFITVAQSHTDVSETDSVEIQFVILPDSTAFGKLKGKKVSKEIGPSGGTIRSDDGKVELIFPPDALDAAKEISIQPVEAIIPNGSSAYHFEPSGIQFLKPVEIVFRYSEDEAFHCPPDLKFMALQDENGKWEYMTYDIWDSSAMTLKGFINHFSTFLDGNEVQLSQTEIELKVREAHNFSLNIVQPPLPPDAGEDELPPLPATVKKGDWKAAWRVNGRSGGSGKYGTIVSGRGSAVASTYTAPATFSNDPITVTLEINKTTIRKVVQRSRGWRGETLVPTTTNLATFACRVNLYDQYKIAVNARGQFNLECEPELTDQASYEITVYPNKKPIISEARNEPPVITKQARCRGGYPLKYEVTTDCQGPVHVKSGSLMGYGITYSSGNEPAEYRFEFVESMVRIATGTGKYPEQTRGSYTEKPMDVNVGNKIKFKLNRQQQTYESLDDDCECRVKITVTPI